MVSCMHAHAPKARHSSNQKRCNGDPNKTRRETGDAMTRMSDGLSLYHLSLLVVPGPGAV